MSSEPTGANATYNNEFSDYYDRLNQHKDYVAEVDRLDVFIRQHVKSARPRVLDIGCGTGQHAALLAGKGHDVTAIDLSPGMIRIAKTKETDAHFFACDIAGLDRTGFECAYSLFNVVNCLDSLDSLTAFFTSISGRLKVGAMFLVESWNPVAVIAEPPVVVERIYEGPRDRIVRTVTPALDFLRQRLDLRYDIDVFGNDAPNSKLHSFSVVHSLVLFTPLEIEFCLGHAGFAAIEICTALPGLVPATASDRMLAFLCRKSS